MVSDFICSTAKLVGLKVPCDVHGSPDSAEKTPSIIRLQCVQARNSVIRYFLRQSIIRSHLHNLHNVTMQLPAVAKSYQASKT